MVPVDATLPTLWLITTVIASVTLQLKVELSPTVIVEGRAEKELMVGASCYWVHCNSCRGSNTS